MRLLKYNSKTFGLDLAGTKDYFNRGSHFQAGAVANAGLALYHSEIQIVWNN